MNQLPRITKITAEATSKIDWKGKGPKEKNKGKDRKHSIIPRKENAGMLPFCIYFGYFWYIVKRFRELNIYKYFLKVSLTELI